MWAETERFWSTEYFECCVTGNGAKLEQLTATVPPVSTAVGIADMSGDLSFTVYICVGRRLYLALLRWECGERLENGTAKYSSAVKWVVLFCGVDFRDTIATYWLKRAVKQLNEPYPTWFFCCCEPPPNPHKFQTCLDESPFNKFKLFPIIIMLLALLYRCVMFLGQESLKSYIFANKQVPNVYFNVLTL